MLGYATVGVTDLEKSAIFYDAIAEELGTPRMFATDTIIAWGKHDGPAGIGICKPHNGESMSVGNGTMLAFEAKDKDQVQRIYDLALANGGSDEGAPGPRGDAFYAAYFRDPDGNKLNAFVMGAG